MSESVVRFIFDRIVADYARLWKAGRAPAPETYFALWPVEFQHGNAEELVRVILLAEFRLCREQESGLSVERFFDKHPNYHNDEELTLQLLEIELGTAETDPMVETVRQRFPKLDTDRLTQTVELVRLRRSWRPAKKSGNTVPGSLKDAPNSPEIDNLTQVFAENPPPNERDVWTVERSQTIQWADETPQESDGSGTMDFQPTEASTAVTAGTGNTVPDPKNIDKTERGGLTESKEFSVSDSLTVEKYLGSGFWKDVYKARQHSTRQFVALKHLREKNDVEREALVREVRTQAMLTHQNIPPVFGLDVLPSGQALVLEKLVDGQRWSDTIKTRTLEDNLRILLEVSQAVAFAHRQHRIIHRDLKPDNVVVNDNYGEVYLIDWGLAADVDETTPRSSEDRVPHVRELSGVAGTPLYWAPELAAGEPWKCCPATDVFLLGALLYEILTGQAPYELFEPRNGNNTKSKSSFIESGPMLRAVCGIIVPLKQRAPNRYIPDELAAIALKAMSPKTGDRYEDAGYFIDAVKQYQHFSIVTNRCDQNWSLFRALCKERQRSAGDPRSLLSLTLRFLETSDVFKSVVNELELHQLAGEVSTVQNNSETDAKPEIETKIHPTLRSARRGEIESRTELIALTLETGDLTLADAQIGLVAENPLRDPEKLKEMQIRVHKLRTVRRRARLMKWVAVGLLAVFLGSSTLYGYLINEQFKKTALQYRRAEENFQKAQNAVNEFYTTVAKDDAIKNSGLMQLRRKLLDSARKYHEDFVSQKSDDPDVLAGQVSSLFDMAGIETNFGNRHDAIDYYLKAIDLGNELMKKYPKNAKYLDILSKCYKDLGVVYGEEQYPPEQVLDCNQKALAINRQLVADYGEVPEYHRNLARIMHNLGVWELKRGKETEAEKYFQDSLKVRDGMSRFPDPPEYHYGKSQTHFALALTYVNEKRFDAADREFETALRLLEEFRTKYTDRFGNDEINLQGMILFGRGEMNFNKNDWGIARSFFLQAIEPFGVLVEKAPEHIGYQRQLNDALSLVFECLVHENKDEKALELFRQREDSLLETAALFPDVIQFLSQWYLRIAEFHLKRDRKDEAIQALQNGLEPLDILEDGRTPDEENLWKKIRNRLEEISREP